MTVFSPLVQVQRSSGLMASLCVRRAPSAIISQNSETVEVLLFNFRTDAS